MSENGWIKLHRKILRSESLKKFTRIEKFNFLELLMNANYEDETIIIAGENVIIPRGGSLLDIKQLSKDMEIEYRKICSFLEKLEKNGIIEKKNVKHRCLIIFLNYEKYQGNTLEILSENFGNTSGKVSHISQGVTGNSTNTFQELSKNFPRTFQEVDPTLYKRNKEINNIRKEVVESCDSTPPENPNSLILEKPKTKKLAYKPEKYSEDSKPMEFARMMLKDLKALLPDDKSLDKTNIQKWAADFDKLNRIDEKEWSEIEKVWKWANQDSFWQSNIESPGTLRKKYRKLYLQMQKDNNYGSGTKNKFKSDEQRNAEIQQTERFSYLKKDLQPAG
jgi:hypothetical protein